MSERSLDSGFEDYRRERRRRQLESGETHRPLSQHEDAIRQLEKREAMEAQDRRLTREVNEFFEGATRQAATIVQKVSEAQKAIKTKALSTEMEEFLVDAMRRFEVLITIMKRGRDENGPVEHVLEADMKQLVGSKLDEFRYLGTADLPDKHIGQDPFAVGVDAPTNEESESAAEACSPYLVDDDDEDMQEDAAELTSPDVSGPTTATAETDELEEHLVAEFVQDTVEPEAVDSPEAFAAPAPEAVAAPKAKAVAAPEPATATAAPDLERFKEALKQMVRTGLMTKDEARTAYKAKLGEL